MEPYGAALHINDWVVAVFSNRRSGQTQNILCFNLTEDSFKSHGGQMMALVHDDVAIVRDEIFDITFALQTLDHGNINHASSLDLSASKCDRYFQLAVSRKAANRSRHWSMNWPPVHQRSTH